MINNQKILFKFIQTNKNIDWYYISDNYKLSENFIHKFQDKVNWNEISHYQIYQKILYVNSKIKSIGIRYQKFQKLSENFIRKFQT